MGSFRSPEPAGIENLDANYLILVIQFYCDVGAEFDTPTLRSFGDYQMEHVFLLEVSNAWLTQRGLLIGNKPAST